MRFYEITTFRVRAGARRGVGRRDEGVQGRLGPLGPERQLAHLQVVAGAPGGTYLVISSVGSFAEFDKMMAEGEAAWKGMTAEEAATLGKFMKESVLNVVTNRYRLDPGQSYVNAETKAMDPAFWAKK